MRRLIFGGSSLALIVLVATAVLAKEEPGSRATFGQRVTSLFGLIDQGDGQVPPTPPGMPPAANQRHGQGGAYVPFSKQPTATANQGAARAGSATSARRAPTTTPPEPQRAGGSYAEAADESTAVAQRPEYAQPRPSLLLQSRGGATGTTRTTNVTTAAPSRSTTQASPYRAAPATQQPRPAAAPAQVQPAAAIQSIPMTQQPTAEAAPAVVSSRRRPQGSSAPSMEAPSTVAAPSISTTAATPSTAANPAGEPDVFVPTLPTTTPEPAAAAPSYSAPAPIATSPNPAPATLPNPGVFQPLNETPRSMSPSAPSLSSTATLPTAAAIGRSASGAPGVLASFNSPEITVETLGPSRISIGRRAEYRVVVRNRGNSDAHQVLIAVDLPDWADIEDLHGTAGHDGSNEMTGSATVQWKLDVLAARAQEEVTIVVVPRRSEAFDLAVRWSCSPAAMTAAIEVEEPQLQMSINGPTEVSYGEQRLYKLIVSNPGTGTADNVVLHLMPLAPGDGDAVSHAIGALKAGESTTVEVELTARQAGTLRIRTEATADGNLKADAASDVIVRRANLDIVTAAPRMLFAGVPGTYEVRVRNIGDDVARNVRLSVDLPTGAKLLSATPATKNDGKPGPLSWTFERLAAGSEQVCIIKCAMEQGGVQQLTVAAAADGDLRKTAQAATDVQAVADLALDIVDTAGPVPVGQPVVYEIKVKNRGMKGAEGVDVVAYFSDGIEPSKAEGQAFEVQPGMVIFKTLPVVGANQERVLRVTALATTPGNHRLRVEMRSAAPQTQLSHEDSTFFYADESTPGATSSAPATIAPSAVLPTSPNGGVPVGGSLRRNAGAGPTLGGASTVYPSATTTPAAGANSPAVMPYALPTNR